MGVGAPHYRTAFIGRQADLAAVVTAASESRLVTLTRDMRTKLGEERWLELTNRGRAMTSDELIEFARAEVEKLP